MTAARAPAPPGASSRPGASTSAQRGGRTDAARAIEVWWMQGSAGQRGMTARQLGHGPPRPIPPSSRPHCNTSLWWRTHMRLYSNGHAAPSAWVGRSAGCRQPGQADTRAHRAREYGYLELCCLSSLGLDRRRRLGEGSASGVPWGDSGCPGIRCARQRRKRA
jgi:hypothetical protein